MNHNFDFCACQDWGSDYKQAQCPDCRELICHECGTHVAGACRPATDLVADKIDPEVRALLISEHR